MTKKIIAILLLAALILTPANPKAAVEPIIKTGTVSKYITKDIGGTAFTMSGMVSFDKKGGLFNMDYITWNGNVSHNKQECRTGYEMYLGTKLYKSIYLPHVKDKTRTFLVKTNQSAKKYSYAELHMDTPAGQYILRAKR